MHKRLFRALLRLLPEEVRSLYAGEMETTFEAERRAAVGRWSMLRLWSATLVDVFRTAPSEHFDILSRDLRYAWRTMATRRGHMLAAIATLALGIGANVAMFAVVDSVLLKPLPFEDPAALVKVAETSDGDDPSNVGFLTFKDLEQRSRSFSSLVAAASSTATLTGGELEAERVSAMRVSRDYFEMLGTLPSIGRDFIEEEDRPGEARSVVVLSHSLWQRRWSGDRGVVGSTIEISGRQYRVVGVMPESFDDLVAERLYSGAELWYPLGYDEAASYACRTCRHLMVFGRLQPEVTPAMAETELTSIFASLEQEHPKEYNSAGAQLTRLSEVFLGPVRPALLVLWVGVVALLLIACANVANFLLLRASEREHEVTVRTALGITPSRMVRQWMTESMLLSAIGGLVGFLPAWAAVRLLSVAGPDELPRLSQVSIDPRAVGITLCLVIASGVVFGLAPLRLVARRNAATGRGNARSTSTVSSWRLRSALLTMSVALAVVLLVGSGLLVRSMSRLLAVDPGFETANTLTMQLWATGQRFRGGETEDQIASAVSFYDDLLTRIEGLAGVEAAAGVTTLPLGGGLDGHGLHIVGQKLDNPEQAPSADRFVVTPHFSQVMGIALEQGRFIGEIDGQDSEAVVVINRTAAKELFPRGNALGQSIRLGGETGPARRIVGVAADIKHHGLDVPVRYQVYVPQAQWAWAETYMTLIIRTDGDPLSFARPVREVILEVDPAQPVSHVESYEAVVASATATRSFAALLLSLFAAAAFSLALIGLYSAVGVLVGQRQREIGLRIALGAHAAAIRRMVLARGMKPVLAGLLLGIVISLFAVSALRSLVYGIATLDPLVFAGSIAVLAIAALCACWLPASKAARIDPSLHLRCE